MGETGQQSDRVEAMEQTKTCPRCKVTKSLALYAKNKTSRSGLSSHCRECTRKGWSRSRVRSRSADSRAAQAEAKRRDAVLEQDERATAAACKRLAATTAEALGR